MSRLKTLVVLNFGIYESLWCEKPILFSIPRKRLGLSDERSDPLAYS